MKEKFPFRMAYAAYIRRRFYAGMFTSVTPTYFVIAKFWIEHGTDIEVRGDGLFNETLATMYEGKGSLNCADLTQYFAANMAWGPDGNVMASRKKIDGDFCYITKKHVILPGMILENDQSLPPCEMEWDHVSFHVLKPYGVASREFGKEDCYFLQDHKWHPSLVASDEGTILLTIEGEKRVKYSPAIELMYLGQVWEYDIDGNRIAPRYGKSVQVPKIFVPLESIPVPKFEYSIRCEKNFGKKPMWIVEKGKDVLLISNDYTDDVIESVVSAKGPLTVTFANGRSVVRSVLSDEVRECSVRCFVYDVETDELKLFKDSRRHLFDTIGGRIEPFETPLQAVDRECFEETGYRLQCGATLIGVMPTDYMSVWVYVVPYQYSGLKGLFRNRTELQQTEISPWFAELDSFVNVKKGEGTYGQLWRNAIGMRHIAADERQDIVTFQNINSDVKIAEVFAMYEKRYGPKSRSFYEYMLTIAYRNDVGGYSVNRSRLVNGKNREIIDDNYFNPATKGKLKFVTGQQLSEKLREAEARMFKLKHTKMASIFYYYGDT